MQWKRLLLVSISLSACTKIARNNQFDSAAPDAVRAKGQVTGELRSEGGGVPAEAKVTAVSGAKRYEASVALEGNYFLEAPSGVYLVSFTAPGHTTQVLSGISLEPGKQIELPMIVLTVAKGAVSGRITLNSGGPARDETPGSGVDVSLVRADGTPGVHVTQTNPDGTYNADGLPAGSYRVRARLQDYAPGYLSELVQVTASASATAPPLTLFPATAIIQTRLGSDIAPRFVATRTIEVQLLAFVERLTNMRVSLDQTFSNAASGNTDYVQFAATAPFTLADLEGEQTIFAQFKDADGLESDVFSTTVTLDRTAPTVLQFTVDGGAAYVTQNTASLFVQGFDEASGIAGFRLSLDGTLDDEPLQPLLSQSSVVAHLEALALGLTDGTFDLRFTFSDRAGNVSEEASVLFVKDTHAPTVGSPAIALQGGGNTARDRKLKLVLDAQGEPSEPLYVQIIEGSGISNAVPKQAIVSPFEFTLADGPDGARSICAVFSDAAGNASAEYCTAPPIDLNRTGTLTGSVEGDYSDFSPTAVTIVLTNLLDATVRSTSPNSSGDFTFTAVSAAGVYKLELSSSAPKYVAGTLNPTVLAGSSNDIGTVRMFRERGFLTGHAFKSGASGGGVVINLLGTSFTTITDATGAWTISDLPTGPYTAHASFDGFVDQNYPLKIVDADGEVAGSLTLTPESGVFKICRSAGGCTTSDQFTSNRNVYLVLDCTGQGADEFFASTSGTLPGSPAYVACPNPASTPVLFQLDDIEGGQDINVWYHASGGGAPVGPLVNAVSLDRLAPTVQSVVIDADALYTRHPLAQVTLNLSGSDAGPSGSGVAKVKIAYTSGAVAAATPVPFSSTLTYTLNATADTATDGPKQIFIALCDALDQCAITPVSDGITLDRLAPSVASGVAFDIAAGASQTRSSIVDLSIATADAVALRYGNASDLSAVPYVAVPSSTTVLLAHTLLSGDGLKTVYMQFKDAAGNESSPLLTDTISLDTQAPSAASVTIGGATPDFVNSESISVTLAATGATEMFIDGDLTDDSNTFEWIAYATSKSLTLTSTECLIAGCKLVRVKFRDAAGNETSPVSDVTTLDKTAPSQPSISVAAGDYSPSTTVVLNLAAVGADRMKVATDGVINTEPFEAYSIAKTVTLATGSTYTIAVQYFDYAGNASGVVTDTVTVDTTPPTVDSFTVTPVTTKSLDVTVNLASTGATEMQLSSRSDFAGSAWQSIATSWPVTVSSGDGPKPIYVRVRDAAGNINTGSPSATTTLDQTAPTGVSLGFTGVNVVLDAGVTYAGAAGVTLSLAATGAAQMQFANDAQFSSAGAPVAYATTFPWTLPAGDAQKIVYARFYDSVGNIATTSATIVLDTESPQNAAVSVLEGALVASTAVNLALSAVDAAQMYIDGCVVDTSSTKEWVSYNPVVAVTLDTIGVGCVGDGAKNITVNYRDHALHTALASTSVTLDTGAPSPGTLVITGVDALGASTTRTRTPSVTLTATSTGATQMMFSNDSAFTGASWATYSTAPQPWTLSFGDSLTKTVYFKFKDTAGNPSGSQSATIILDTTGSFSPTISISGGDYTQSASLSLALSATAADQMYIDGDVVDDSNTKEWVSYSVSKTVTLAGADCDPNIPTLCKRVSVKYRDLAGNESETVEDFVALDTVNPSSPSVSITSGNLYSGTRYTSTASVTLALSAVGATKMIIAADGTIDTELEETFAPTKTLPIGTGAAAQTIRVRFKDNAGRVSSDVTDTITYDATAPTVTTFSASPSGTVNTQQVLVTVGATGAVEYQLANDVGFAGSSWLAYPSSPQTIPWSLLPSDGPKTIYLRMRDGAQNVVTPTNLSLTLDQSPPTGATLGFAGGNIVTASGVTYAKSTTVNLSMSATGATTMRFANNATFSGASSFEAYATSKNNWTLDNGDGTKSVFARFADAAGNTVDAVGTLVLDTQPPQNPTITVPASTVKTSTVALSLGAVEATEMWIDGAGVVDDTVTKEWIAYSTTATITLTAGEGSKVINVKYRDIVGNETAVIAVTPTLTLDTTPPAAGTMTITGKAQGVDSTVRTNITAVKLTVASTGAAEVMFGNDSNFTNGTWQTYNAGSQYYSWTLASGDSTTKTVYAQFRDTVGNVQGTVTTQTIDLDQTAPTSPTILLNSGAAYTNAIGPTHTVTATLGAAAATQMRLSTDGVFDTELWVAYATSTSVNLPTGDGLKTVFVVMRDAAGNESPAVNDSITLDTSGPTASSFVINAGAAFTTSIAVSLTLASISADEMQIGTDPTLDTEPWVPFSNSATVVLPTGDCATLNCKTVRVKMRDYANNQSATLTQSITLDATAPSAMQITTQSTTVNAGTINIFVGGQATDTFFGHYEVAFGAGFTTMSLLGTNPNYFFTVPLTQGSGGSPTNKATNNIRVRAVDLAGNIGVEDSVTIFEDSAAPANPILMAPTNLVVNADVQTVRLQPGSPSALDATFDHYELCSKTTADCTSGDTWSATSVRDNFTFTLTPDSANHLCARAHDAAAATSTLNISGVYCVTVTEDSDDPLAPTVYPPDGGTIHSSKIAIGAMSATDPGGHFDHLEARSGTSGAWATVAVSDIPHVSTTKFTGLQPDALNKVCVRGVDSAGNKGLETCVDVTDKTTTVVDQSINADRYPVVSGDYVAYGRFLASSDYVRVYLRNIRTGSESVMTGNTTDAKSVRISNNYLVWEETAGSGQIWVRDIRGSTTYTINEAKVFAAPTGTHEFSQPDVDGEYLTFYDKCTAAVTPYSDCTLAEVGTVKLRAMQLSTVSSTPATTTVLSLPSVSYSWDPNLAPTTPFDTALDAAAPRVDCGHVVALAKTSSTRSIVTYDLPAVFGATLAGTNHSTRAANTLVFPSGGCKYAVWFDQSVSKFNWYQFSNTGTGSGTYGAVTSAGLSLNPALSSSNPTFDVYGSKIVYNATKNGGFSGIYLRDFEDASTTSTELTHLDVVARFPQIQGNRVVFSDDRNYYDGVFKIDLGEDRWAAVGPWHQGNPKISNRKISYFDQYSSSNEAIAFHDATALTSSWVGSTGPLAGTFVMSTTSAIAASASTSAYRVGIMDTTGKVIVYDETNNALTFANSMSLGTTTSDYVDLTMSLDATGAFTNSLMFFSRYVGTGFGTRDLLIGRPTSGGSQPVSFRTGLNSGVTGGAIELAATTSFLAYTASAGPGAFQVRCCLGPSLAACSGDTLLATSSVAMQHIRATATSTLSNEYGVITWQELGVPTSVHYQLVTKNTCTAVGSTTELPPFKPYDNTAASSRRMPSVSENYLVWMDSSSGQWDIMGLDLMGGLDAQSARVFRVTDDTFMQIDPEVSGKSIVWEDYRLGNADVFTHIE